MDALAAWAGTNASKLLTPKFFFWSPGDTMQKSSVGLLRSLLYQIFHEHPQATPLPDQNEPVSEWTEKRLRKVFNSIAYNLSRSYRVCLFIDGLDEFNGDHDELIEMFQELVRYVNIKVVLSSRPYLSFERAFSCGAMLKLQDLTRGDIEKFVSDKLLASPRVHFLAAQEPQRTSKTAISTIIKDIVRKAEGVFLWVDLAVKDQIRGINDEDSLEQLEERLRILPSGLEDLYAHMLNNIQKVHRKEAASFFHFALAPLVETSKSLLDSTLATYERLDHDLGSPAGFPSEDVLSGCESTRRRIITTCAGLLEVHEKDQVSEDSSSEELISEDSFWEDSIRGYSNTRVTFLHRTVADFLTESEQGRKFLDMNTPSNGNIFVVWAKALVAKVRMFRFKPEPMYTSNMSIETVMMAASDAEYETGVAQIAVYDYIDLAMKILYQKRDNHSPGRHWCLDIYEWGDSHFGLNALQLHLEYLRGNSFASDSIEVKEHSSSRSVSESPVDFLGFAASCGLKFYMEQHIKSVSADHRPSTANYLLCCVISSIAATHPSFVRFHGLLDLICTLLEYGGNPNMPAFGSTVWGHFLALVFRVKTVADKHVWKRVLESFILRGADTKGILGFWTFESYFPVFDDQLHLIPNASWKSRDSQYYCYFRLHINISVPTVIQYCLGDSPIFAEMISICMENGASLYCKCTEISIMLNDSFDGWPKEYETWTLSEQQSDRLVEALERHLIRIGELPGHGELGVERQVPLLYNELSAREPHHSSRPNEWIDF